MVAMMMTAGHLPGGQDGGGGVGRCGDLAKVLDGLGGHRYLAGHLSHRFISYLRPSSFCDVLEKKKNSCTIYCSAKNANLERGAQFSFFFFLAFAALVTSILAISLFCCPPKSL